MDTLDAENARTITWLQEDMARYKDIGDGWVKVKKRGFRLRCCSCGLIHTVDFRHVNGDIEIRMERHERATKAARRAITKKVVIVED